MAYRYITNTELARLLRSGSNVAVVDVRDDDFHGGNIVGAIRHPSEQHTEQRMSELVKKLHGVPTVVFHCALSQVRGPKSARIYAQELSRQTSSAPSDSHGAGQAFSPNLFPPAQQQEVLVLREGFTGFQSLYRNDPQLVEKWDKSVWGVYAS